MSKTQRKRRLRRRQTASQRTARTTSVAITGSLLTAAALAASPSAMAAQSDITLLKEFTPGPDSTYIGQKAVVGSTVYFAANDQVKGSELWKSDGTAAGTQIVKDINPDGIDGSYPHDPVTVGSTVFFIASDGNGSELWKTNGSAAGTTPVTDLPEYSFAGNTVGVAGGNVFFTVFDGDGYDLWKADVATGASSVVGPTSRPNGGDGRSAVVGSTLYFVASDSANGNELWKTDGTAAGTGLVKDIRPGQSVPDSPGDPTYPLGGNPYDLSVVGGTLVFSADDGVSGRELWKSDGTAAGTTVLKDINPESYSYPTVLGTIGNTLYFGADDGEHGYELWKTDGTTAGTTLAVDIREGGASSSPRSGAVIGNTLYMSARGDTQGRELWKSDGTPAGTALVADINTTEFYPGYTYGSNVSRITNVDGKLFFVADDGTSGYELWKSDGTSAGTGLVADLTPPPAAGAYAGYGPAGLQAAGTKLFFTADDGVRGFELYSTTSSATTLPVATNQTSPRVVGTPAIGNRVTADPGTWSTTGLTYTYQWLADGNLVDGATASSYTPGTGDLGKRLSVRVTGSKTGVRSSSATSAPSAPVVAEAVVNQAPPAISGAAKVGSALTASTGTWTPTGLSYAYQWQVNGVAVAGATTNRYVVPPTAVGKTITVTVTASRSDLGSASSTSSPTARVAAGTLRSTTAPAITGQAKVGKTLKLKPGAVSPAATRTTIQWLRNGKPIAGAKKATYKLTKKDKGKKISAKVTYTRAGYAALVKVTKATAKVKK